VKILAYIKLEVNMQKEIDGYEDYLISDDGRVFSKKRQIYLKDADRGTGYRFVSLYKNGNVKKFLIHRLMALAFLPNPKNKPAVNHKNGIKTDNRLENLEWSTNAQNIQHAWRSGLNETTREAVKEAQSKKVICVETGQIFNSAREASGFLGLNDKAVSNSIYQNCKSGGFHWLLYKGELND